MADRTTATHRTETFVTTMTERMAALARTVSDWEQAEARPLQEIEEQLVRVLHDLGNLLLAALLPLAAPARPRPDVVVSLRADRPLPARPTGYRHHRPWADDAGASSVCMHTR